MPEPQRIQTLLVEDDVLYQDLLRSFLEQIPDILLVDICETCQSAVALLQTRPVDWLISDINLPDRNALSMLKTLPNPPALVLITSFPEYALQGYEVNALDFLVKPITFDRLLGAVRKVRSALQNRDNHPDEEDAHIFIRADYRYIKILFKEILYIESEKDFVKIVTSQGVYMPNLTTRAIENELPATDFVRVHRSFIVNIHHITAFSQTVIYLGELELPLGMSYRDSVSERLLNNRLLKR